MQVYTKYTTRVVYFMYILNIHKVYFILLRDCKRMAWHTRCEHLQNEKNLTVRAHHADTIFLHFSMCRIFATWNSSSKEFALHWNRFQALDK